MSIRIMADVWANGPEDKAQLLVLLALSDFADDDGKCWPSMAAVGRKARMSERNARRVIRSLEDDGYLSVVEGGGRYGCSQYTINNPVKMPPPPDKITRTECPSPGQNDAETRTKQHGNPDIAVSAEPSTTIKEPSVVKVKAPPPICAILCEVLGVTEQAAQSFIAYRKNHKSKSLTETAARRLVKHLWAVVEQGGDPSDALGMAEEKGWASVEPHWYFNAKGNSHDNRTSNPNFGSSPRQGDRVDPALANIARIAGLGLPPGNGCH